MNNPYSFVRPIMAAAIYGVISIVPFFPFHLPLFGVAPGLDWPNLVSTSSEGKSDFSVAARCSFYVLRVGSLKQMLDRYLSDVLMPLSCTCITTPLLLSLSLLFAVLRAFAAIDTDQEPTTRKKDAPDQPSEEIFFSPSSSERSVDSNTSCSYASGSRPPNLQNLHIKKFD